MAISSEQDAEVVTAEHPMEIARQAIMAAAELEGPEWSAVMIRFAEALPPRTVTDDETELQHVVEHPVEIARRALLAAADVEDDDGWATAIRRAAEALPARTVTKEAS